MLPDAASSLQKAERTAPILHLSFQHSSPCREDDLDFSEILRKARESNLGTVVVGGRDRALGRHAELWVLWIRVENGELTEKDLVLKGRWRSEDLENDEGLFSVMDFDEDGDYRGSDLEGFVNGLVMARSGFNGMRISAFSEREEEDEKDYLLYDIEYEEIEFEDEGFRQ